MERALGVIHLAAGSGGRATASASWVFFCQFLRNLIAQSLRQADSRERIPRLQIGGQSSQCKEWPGPVTDQQDKRQQKCDEPLHTVRLTKSLRQQRGTARPTRAAEAACLWI